jgi:hypothetical protein
MRKLIAVGVLVGGLLAGAGSAMAQQGGVGDPLTLAASGVLIPYITSGGTVALVEVASPVGANANLHLIFYNATCTRTVSLALPETINDIAFVDVGTIVAANQNGLVAIAGTVDGFNLTPLTNPIHSRIYEFSTVNGRSRVFEPIILDSAEFPGTNSNPPIRPTTWSPLRTGATFFAPLFTATVNTELTFICPRTTIQGLALAAFQDPGFPVMTAPAFKTAPVASPIGDMHALIYDVGEVLLRDVNFTCDCLSPDVPVTSIDLVYANAVAAPSGTYTEISTTFSVADAATDSGPFTGYRGVFTVGSGINNFWGRLSDGNRLSLGGTVTGAR